MSEVTVAGGTKIAWCDFTFNPWWGCDRVSPGCANCYADTIAHHRAPGQNLWGPEHEFRFFDDGHWQLPERWARVAPGKLGRRPRVFAASMADVFEARVELDRPRERLFALIAATPELDWLVLTKRPDVARILLGHPMFWLGVNGQLLELGHPVLPGGMTDDWPSGGRVLENLWLGVSVENARFTWRVEALRSIPAAVKFISAEPLLGSLYPTTPRSERHAALDLTGIDWVIVGGESGGRNARPMAPAWARELRNDCLGRAAFFFKQWGSYAPAGLRDPARRGRRSHDVRAAGDWMRFHGAGPDSGGHTLDGVTWREFPTMSLETRIKELLEPEIAGPPRATAYQLVEVLLAAWQELHRERALYGLDDHRHYIDIANGDRGRRHWSIQHPITCRPNLNACSFALGMASEAWEHDPAIVGRYEVALLNGLWLFLGDPAP